MQIIIALFVVALIFVPILAEEHHEEDDGLGYYKFEYGVEDPHTGDHKTQQEHRDGKHVTGSYTLKEADGTLRVVKYFAGPHDGFNAVVERIGHAQHPAVYGHHGAHGGDKGDHVGHGGTSYISTTHFGHHYNH